jgi:thiosulfate/3-mercaptopyruvate sulfurtransferase
MQGNELLVSAVDLARHLGAPDWIVVDCRFNLMKPDAGEAAWRAGHIPGAWYAHLDRDLASPPTAATGRHPLPRPEALAATFSRWGVREGTRVVAYDDAGGAIAARLWWLLRWMGHREALLLDGGFPAWQAAGLPVSTEPPAGKPSEFKGRAGHMPTIEVDELRRALARDAVLLLDARAQARFRGEVEPVDPVAGHVPGAVNAPFQASLGDDGRFRDAQALGVALRATLGGRAPGEVAYMCGSGVTACHGLFAMELAGLAGGRLYPGSWSEWIRSPDRPVARG